MRVIRKRRRALAFVTLVIAACVGTSIQMSSTSQKQTLALENHDFGDVQVGTQSAFHTFTIEPASGEQLDTVEMVSENCNDFELDADPTPATVSNVCDSGTAGSSTCTATVYQFRARFTPVVVNATPVSCAVTVHITDNGSGSTDGSGSGSAQTVTLFGRGVQPPVKMTVAPTASNFGTVPVGETGSRNITITNVGSGPESLMISSIALDAAAAGNGFTIFAGGNTSTIPPNNQSATVTVRCAPLTAGPRTATLTVTATNNSNPADNVKTVNLTCTGVVSDLRFNPPELDLTGEEDLGALRIGDIQTPPAVILSNAGGLGVTINSISAVDTSGTLTILTGGAAGALGSGASRSITLSFQATAEAEVGSTLAELVVNYDAGEEFKLPILGGVVGSAMAVNPDGTYDFGPVCIGVTRPSTFAVSQSNVGRFRIDSVTAPAAPFALSNPPPAGTLVDGNAVTFDVTLAPTEADDNISSSFTITTDIPNDPPRTITLKGIGLAQGIAPTPSFVDYGNVPVGGERTAMVKLSNCETTPLDVTAARVIGANFNDFVLDSPANVTIEPGQFQMFSVTMRPTRNGTRNGTLEIVHDNGIATIRLLGDASGGVDDVVKSTYYSCDAGGRSGWFVVFAVIVLLLPRERARRLLRR